MTLQGAIREAYIKRRTVVTDVMVGGVRTYDEYRFQLGMLRGMYELMADIDHLMVDPDEIEERHEG